MIMDTTNEKKLVKGNASLKTSRPGSEPDNAKGQRSGAPKRPVVAPKGDASHEPPKAAQDLNNMGLFSDRTCHAETCYNPYCKWMHRGNCGLHQTHCSKLPKRDCKHTATQDAPYPTPNILRKVTQALVQDKTAHSPQPVAPVPVVREEKPVEYTMMTLPECTLEMTTKQLQQGLALRKAHEEYLRHGLKEPTAFSNTDIAFAVPYEDGKRRELVVVDPEQHDFYQEMSPSKYMDFLSDLDDDDDEYVTYKRYIAGLVFLIPIYMFFVGYWFWTCTSMCGGYFVDPISGEIEYLYESEQCYQQCHWSGLQGTWDSLFFSIVVIAILACWRRIKHWIGKNAAKTYKDALYVKYSRVYRCDFRSFTPLPTHKGRSRLAAFGYLSNPLVMSEDFLVPIGLCQFLATKITPCHSMSSQYQTVASLTRQWCKENEIDDGLTSFYVVQCANHLRPAQEEWNKIPA